MDPDEIREEAKKKEDEATELKRQADDKEAKLRDADKLQEQADAKRDEAASGSSPGFL